MKKILALCFSMLTILCFALCLVGCNGSGGLKYGEKYYLEDADNFKEENEELRTYYRFFRNGTGEYHRYYINYYGETSAYVFKFSFTFADNQKEAVVCTYESMEYSELHTASKTPNTEWSIILTVSENILMTNQGTMYFSGSYLKAHPNFYSEAE